MDTNWDFLFWDTMALIVSAVAGACILVGIGILIGIGIQIGMLV